jgi:hypothetical protein
MRAQAIFATSRCGRHRAGGAVTASVGTNVTSEKSALSGPISSHAKPNTAMSSEVKTKSLIITNKNHHQNSERSARPEKSAYLVKQVFSASEKPMACPFVLFSQ